MFDFGFSELVVIAVVALVVVGPERLPAVARTVGALLGRLNRYVSDVKADVEREMRLDEMKKLRADVEQQALGIEQQVVRELEETRSAVSVPVADAVQSVDAMMQDTAREFAEVAPPALTGTGGDNLPHRDFLRSQKNGASAAQAATVTADAPDSARRTELADAAVNPAASATGSSTLPTDSPSKA